MSQQVLFQKTDCRGGNSILRSLPLIAIAAIVVAVAFCIAIAPSSDAQDNASYTDDQGVEYQIIGTTADEKTAFVCGYEGSYPSVAIPKKITIESVVYDVIAIGDNAFKGRAQLVSVAIPDSIISVGNSAFEGCSSIESVSVPDSVTYIGGHAFEGCTSLESLGLSKNITFISERMFCNCISLGSIAIPSGVTFIGQGAFQGCIGLRSVDLPSGITSIGQNAFAMCVLIESVKVPAATTFIGENAFAMCTSLKSVNIPAGVAAIGDYTFAYCPSLASVNLPETVTEIRQCAFMGCESLGSLSIPEKVTAIGVNAFLGCASLESLEIPANVKSIGQGAFLQCNHLKAINVDPANGGYASVDGVLFDKSMAILVQYPAAKTGAEYNVPSGVNTIGRYAFNCSELTSVVLPVSVVTIQNSAFNCCGALSSVTMASPSKITSIGDYAFYGCTSLRSISIPASVGSVGQGAFQGCTSLISVTLPAGIDQICSELFSGCTSLTSVTIPAGVNFIDINAFYGCTSLTSVTIPAGVTSISDNAFYGCTSLTSVTIPAGVNFIDINAFYGCTSLTSISVDADNRNYSSADGVLFDKDGYTLITYPAGKRGSSYQVPSTVRTIGEGAFLESAYLTSVTISSSVSSIGQSAFHGCTALSAINVDADNRNYSSADGVLFDKERSSLVRYPSARSAPQYSVPDTVGTIAAGAFCGCASLRSVAIPSSVASIGDGTFNGCTALSSISVDADNMTYSSVDGILYNKDRAVLIKYPAAKGDEEYLLLSTVQSFREGAFRDCSSLKAIRVAAGNDKFSSVDGVLFDKDGRQLIVYPAGKTDAEYRIPSGVITVKQYAFAGSAFLKSVIIPSNVKTLDDHAFYGCTALENITFGAFSCLGTEDNTFDLSGDTGRKVNCTVWSLYNVAKGALSFSSDYLTVFAYDESQPSPGNRTVDIPVAIIAGIVILAAVAAAGIGVYVVRSRKKE